MIKIPLPKLKAILLYFGSYTDTRFLGKTKLMKLFYFLDFMHLKIYGAPITYDRYVNLEHGPIPSMIKNLVDEAVEDPDHSALSDTIRFETPTGTVLQRMIPTRAFSQMDEKYLSDNELEILKKVCLRFGDKNTKYIEDASHQEAPWKETAFLDDIPYTLALKDSDCLVRKEEIELMLELQGLV